MNGRAGPNSTPRESAHRFRRLPRRSVLGIVVPVATTYRARVLGLAWLDLRRAGNGLLLPDCRGVHTFGMRFDLDLVFLDDAGREIRRSRAVPPGRLRAERAAAAVLELPARSPTGGVGRRPGVEGTW